jgi:hypothetical protein
LQELHEVDDVHSSQPAGQADKNQQAQSAPVRWWAAQRTTRNRCTGKLTTDGHLHLPVQPTPDTNLPVGQLVQSPEVVEHAVQPPSFAQATHSSTPHKRASSQSEGKAQRHSGTGHPSVTAQATATATYASKPSCQLRSCRYQPSRRCSYRARSRSQHCRTCKHPRWCKPRTEDGWSSTQSKR